MIWISLVWVVVDWPVALIGGLFCVAVYAGMISPFTVLGISPIYYDAVFGLTLSTLTVLRFFLGRAGGFNV